MNVLDINHVPDSGIPGFDGSGYSLLLNSRVLAGFDGFGLVKTVKTVRFRARTNGVWAKLSKLLDLEVCCNGTRF